MATIINWRDADPVISHHSAVVWACLQPTDSVAPPNDKGAPAPVLERLGVMTVHAIQGRRASDHHKHEKREQVYYVLKGHGEVLCGDTRCAIEEGDALYLPSGLYHQIFNRSDDWILHHVISMNVTSDGGAFLQRNWRHTKPVSDESGAMRWHLLKPEGDTEASCLRGLAWIDRESIQPRGGSKNRQEEVEQIYYILGGHGVMTMDGQTHSVCEGDMIHVPSGVTYSFENKDETWLTSLIVGG